MMMRLHRYTVGRWASEFIKSLEGVKEIQEFTLTKKVNTTRLRHVVSCYKESEKRILFLDYDGTLAWFKKNPEDAKPAPRSVYGASKAAGEAALLASEARHLMIRTAWVYAAHGQNFMRKMIELGRERQRLSIVDDQIGCPTWARNLAAATCIGLDTASNESPGILHYSDADAVTWYDFARRIFERARDRGLLERVPELTAVGSDAYPTPAVRPRYSVLDPPQIPARYGVKPAPLDASLEACLKEFQDSE